MRLLHLPWIILMRANIVPIVGSNTHPSAGHRSKQTRSNVNPYEIVFRFCTIMYKVRTPTYIAEGCENLMFSCISVLSIAKKQAVA
jgi:hypothetical protein